MIWFAFVANDQHKINLARRKDFALVSGDDNRRKHWENDTVDDGHNKQLLSVAIKFKKDKSEMSSHKLWDWSHRLQMNFCVFFVVQSLTVEVVDDDRLSPGVQISF